MLASSEPERTREPATAQDAEPSRAVELAAAGLTARLVTPGRIHAANGHLHNAMMLSDLLARQVADAAGAEGPLHRRVASITAELEAIERELKLLHGMLATPPAERHERCNAELALLDAQNVLRTEAARLSARLWVHPPGDAVQVRGSRAAVAKACIVCGLALLERAARGGAVTIVARDGDDGFALEFTCTASDAEGGSHASDPDDALSIALIAAVAAQAGGSLTPGVPLRLLFPHAGRARDGHD